MSSLRVLGLHFNHPVVEVLRANAAHLKRLLETNPEDRPLIEETLRVIADTIETIEGQG